MNRIAPNIIQLLNSQEPDAIEQLYDQYGSTLHGIVLRTLVELVYFNQYTFEEVSQKTGIPLGTVKTRMRYAISALRKIYIS